MIDVKRTRRARLQDSDKKYAQLLQEFKKEKYLHPPAAQIEEPEKSASYFPIIVGLLSAMVMAGLIILLLYR